MAGTLVPVAALVWLATRILQQERDVEVQRARESLRYAAGRLALALNTRLGNIEEQLAQGRGIRFTPQSWEAGDSPLLYQPIPPRAAESLDTFATADTLQFQRNDLVAAANEYRRLSDSPDPAISAAALVRLGAIRRQQHHIPAAIEAYARLERLDKTLVEDRPAALLARQARCRIYETAGDRPRLREEAAALAHVLYTEAWPIDRSTFELYRDMLAAWGAPPPPAEEVARTEAAIDLWQSWRAGGLPPRGRRIVSAGGVPVLAVWTGDPGSLTVWLAPPAFAEELFRPLWKGQGIAVSLYGPDGDRLLGPELADSVALTPAETHLPFILTVAFQSGPQPAVFRARGFLLAGLLLTLAVTVAASYGLYRATSREMALARQQSEFVSTVSHEFRTPLTSIRHLTELLATNSAPTEERKATYYQFLARETERLHRMVESLLSFGRMQAGAYAWRLEPADPRQLVCGVVDEFRGEPHSAAREVVCEADDQLPPIQADREALSRAVSNLLENADKYSPPGTPIHVRAHRAGQSIEISVQDSGAGIPPEEQKLLFRKFVRGEQARRAGIRGIGVGLALVKSVAEAHGGSVQLRSQPGRGSTFTLVIPCRES